MGHGRKPPDPRGVPKSHGRKPPAPPSRAGKKSCPFELVVLVPVVIAGLLIQSALRFVSRHAVSSAVAIAFVATGMLMASCEPPGNPEPYRTIECRNQVCK